ncbi:F0F1 ATP synthase subunit A [Marinigracilibium pacificum]|uniref:ATP synthase subunit a n=1 Tax=Marinigracilibium pacificum TaxID=2729599 RepID=A0A848IY02_9BACT|nr:F0F1 ATP synthase subunit A [Marinigracilibium pacificum]NMM47160.1 F0F1 ATP synthase subunit A [Marinigracilibium pacificum]
MQRTKSLLFILKSIALSIVISMMFISPLSATASEQASGEGESFNPGTMIMHHIQDDYIWHFADGHYGTLYLPVILYSEDRGLEVFSSSNFYNEDHEVVPYNGYEIHHGKIHRTEGHTKVWDFSITKNVAFLFLTMLVMILVFTAVARGYKKRPGKSPKGIQSLFEPIIIFVRDEIVKMAIGEKKYEKYLPYMLTLFFFIWFGNLLGLLPGAANLTGNIAVTMTLAFGTFLLTTFSGNKHYWGHIFNTPGVPWWLKFPLPIMPVVEFIGIFTKPISLLIRLFVAITAGHIVILSIIGLTFIFQSASVGIGATILTIFINLIELLVATIQAYVFTLFSSMYIGMAVEEHDDHH